MIARFRVLLAFPFSRRTDEHIEPVTLEHGGYRLKVYPPYQARLRMDVIDRSALAINELLTQLTPAEPLQANQTELMDGVPTFHANAFQIDVIGEDFDRRQETAAGDGDPPIRLLIDVANSFLIRLRSVTQSGRVKPVRERGSYWRLEYLTDDEQQLPRVEGLVRTRNMGGFNWSFVALNNAIWQQTAALPSDYQPAVWETLLLDAATLLPEIGPALVLAAAALETLILGALDILVASAAVPSGLWVWINDRDDYRKEPSVEERFDDLLRIIAGKSLKDEKDLWDAFKKLKHARNSFAHAGVASIGGRPVTDQEAHTLLEKAAEITNWVETLLPEDRRRPVLASPPQITFTRMVIAPTA